MTLRLLTVERFMALEANLRVFETELIAFRELIRRNPNYSGDWLDHPQFQLTRRKFILVKNSGTELLRKKHNG